VKATLPARQANTGTPPYSRGAGDAANTSPPAFYALAFTISPLIAAAACGALAVEVI